MTTRTSPITPPRTSPTRQLDELMRGVNTPMAGEKNNAAPTPSKNLESKRAVKLGEMPSPIPDRESKSIPSWEVFLGPQRADNTPAGIWKIPAPSRNDDVRIPSEGRSTERSEAMNGRAGEMLNQLTVYTALDASTDPRTSHLLLPPSCKVQASSKLLVFQP